ncbi:phage antirepressor [Maledivibacter halophilus]|uniref:Phage antirepressor protein YoqD, KilAC domain n=1 Tax=Maledivibacter halophilus TaxID=36842 RepID=A0A1T5K3B0_9FIRM|nr:phage antirepressor KilAC domain-containing protein [Maledivibacter halophilus]SKC58005.1 Phage antirepressor protein YoqD, KilAC domain [Maledivibacter halophilus]
MNELKIFENEEFGQVRMVTEKDEPWFVASDICKSLDIANTTQAMGRLDDDEKSMLNIGLSGGATNCVNEFGLYNLILASRKPSAKKFKRWITHEVLPSIRKTGGYIQVKDDDSNEEILSKALLIAQKTIEQRNARIEEMKPKELFADAVSTSNTTILIGELAKILKANGMDTGQNRLFERLRQDGFLIKRKGTDYNAPTQRAMELGLFRVKETAITHSDGHVTISKTTKVTGKGQQYFIEYFLGGRHE